MSAWKKLASAPAASGGGLNVEDVFSTYLYTGTGSSLTINNGVDLSGEGGFVWIKARTQNTDHMVFDTERGVSNYLRTNASSQSSTASGYLVTSFNNNGFTLGSVYTGAVNNSGDDYASWTWRKAPKFFDCVTYTGDGTTGREIAHNLGTTVGFIAVKRTDDSSSWICYHKDADATAPEDYFLGLNLTAAATYQPNAFGAAPTSTHFTVGSLSSTNISGGTFVAYLFAHNDGDGDFGPTGDQDIIKCGSYTGNGDSSGTNTIELGFEPQWLLIKRYDGTGEWFLMDVMRGMNDNVGAHLDANTTNVEASSGPTAIMARPTGFSLHTGSQFNGSNDDFIYIAIRRGPMAVPTAGTDVFAVDDRDNYNTAPQTGYGYQSNFPVDLLIRNGLLGPYNSGGFDAADIFNARLIEERYLTLNDAAASSGDGGADFDHMDGCYEGGTADTKNIGLMWKRAPNFCDIVTYTGNGTAGRTVSHNLGVAPEMILVKDRGAVNDWAVYHSGVDASAPEDYRLYLNSDAAIVDSVNFWNDTAPTDSNFTVGNGSRVNANTDKYIACLFASLSGISKVGSYTGTGSTLNVDCGFSSGARFVLIKRTDTTGDWYAFNSQTGIVAGDDYYARWNTNGSYTNSDFIDPLNSGFTITSTAPADLNASGGEYIFYAVA